MYLAEKELRNQFNTIEKTIERVISYQTELVKFVNEAEIICVLGCGSSYSIAKSSALQIAQIVGKEALAVAAGDLLVNFEDYKTILKKASLILLSRSGNTSELVEVANLCKQEYSNCKILSVCAAEQSKTLNFSDVYISLPWAFDHSVCQTRTVTNIYAAMLGMCSVVAGDNTLLDELRSIKKRSKEFTVQYEELLKEIGHLPFKNATVLADSGIAGIAEEGTLAFKEICQIDSNFYHVLDVRHGPIVKISGDTLAVVMVSKGDEKLQRDLIKDLSGKTSHTVAFFTKKPESEFQSKYSIMLPEIDDNVAAIFMLYCIQLITLNHALLLGVNPDQPQGLDACIELI